MLLIRKFIEIELNFVQASAFFSSHNQFQSLISDKIMQKTSNVFHNHFKVAPYFQAVSVTCGISLNKIKVNRFKAKRQTL